MADPKRLRKLARWYPDCAEKAANLVIRDLRLPHAHNLGAEAKRIEHMHVAHHPAIRSKEGSAVRLR